MADVCVPRQAQMGIGVTGDLDTPQSTPSLSAQLSRDGTPSTPPFVFPLQADDHVSGAAHPMTLSGMGQYAPRRDVSRPRPSQLSINALPDFDFGAGSSSNAGRLPSPTRSPARNTPPSTHASGHRRGGSEFIGGDRTNGGPMLITSPSANDATSPPPSIPPPGPPSSRRGHAHRRSGAVSQTDVSMIMGRRTEHRGGSAPNTPLEPFFGGPGPGTEAAVLPRVGFSEVLEYIPRPLSTISSDTSSSMSTIRAGHTGTDSLTSLANGTGPPSLRAPRVGRSECDPPRQRASTTSSLASNPTDDEQPEDLAERRAESLPLNIVDIDDVNALGSATHDLPSPHWMEKHALSNASSDLIDRPSSAPTAIDYSTSISRTPPCLPDQTFPQTPSAFPSGPSGEPSPPILARHSKQDDLRYQKTSVRPRSSPEPKVTKKPRKIGSWTGMLRKTKPNHDRQVSSKAQIPPSPRDTVERPEFSFDDITFDEDTTCIIESSAPYSDRPISLQSTTKTASAVSLPSDPDSNDFSPMIDIDAFLGSSDSFVDGHSAGHAGAKRRMHSSGETGGFSGPGMHYHRRAESAPEMESFDRTRFGFPRLGSNPAMTEAIEEEEEEDADHVMGERVSEYAAGLGVNIVELEQNTRDTHRMLRRHFTGNADEQASQPGPLICQRGRRADSFNDAVGIVGLDAQATDFVEVVDADEEVRFSVITKSSDDSTITPTLSHDPLAPRPASAPLEYAMQTPSLTYSATETPSTLSSADYSKTSFDVPDGPRGHTANSSMTDHQITSGFSRTGNPATGSLDDVPSLTSSASTMLSGHPIRYSSSSNMTTSVDRSSSISASVPSRARHGTASKRSSLASLSRLVGSSYNRSKLNIEVCAPPDSPQKSEKRKGHRLSRMMKFWKSKEKLSSS